MECIINWDGLTENKYNEWKEKINNYYVQHIKNTFKDYEYDNVVGLVRVGEVCFDIVLCDDYRNLEDDNLVIDYYVYGTGRYAQATDGTWYEHYDGFNCPLFVVLENEYQQFVEKINNQIIEILNKYSDEVTKSKAILPLLVW